MKKAVVLALAALMVLGVAGAAFAGSDTYTAVPPAKTISSGLVNISAKVNPRLSLTVATDQGDSKALELNWDIDPAATAPVAKDVTLTVNSNKAYEITSVPVFTDLTAAGITTTRSLSGTAAGTKGMGNVHKDTVNLTATDWWQVEPGTYTGTITYTVTQKP